METSQRIAILFGIIGTVIVMFGVYHNSYLLAFIGVGLSTFRIN